MIKWKEQGKKDIVNDPLDRWLTWLDERSPPELVEEVVNMDEAIKAADERYGFVSQDEDSIRAYTRRAMFLSDITTRMDAAREEGHAEGHAQGLAEANLEIARKMKARGRPIEEIAEDTDLSLEVIEKL